MNRQNEIKNIKKLISGSSYGIKTPLGIRPSVTKKSLQKNYKKPITNKLIISHIKNEETLFYFGNENNKEKQSLVMIDIDVQKKNKIGTTAGAILFAKHINKIFKNLYSEPSTNGSGIHMYFTLDKENKNAQEINKILKKLENFLVKESEKIKADIEIVEVKGTLHEIEYKNNKISNIKYGTLAKIPRNLKSFFDKNQQIKISEIEKKYCLEKNNKIKKRGSISGKLINNKYLKKLEILKDISKEIMENKEIKYSKHKVVYEDMAITLMLLMFFKKNKNKDCTLPVKRIGNLWKKLYECSDITRGWNHRRFAIIRNILSKKGLIKWTDNKYSYGDKLIGEKGIACKWEITNKLYNYCLYRTKKSKTQKKSSLMDTKSIENTKILNINKIMYKFKYKKPILSILINNNYDLIISKAMEKLKNMFQEHNLSKINT